MHVPPNQSTSPFPQHLPDGAYLGSQTSQDQMINYVAQNSFSNAPCYNMAFSLSPFPGSSPSVPNRSLPSLPDRPPPPLPSQPRLLSPPPPYLGSLPPLPNQPQLLSPPPPYHGSLPSVPNQSLPSLPDRPPPPFLSQSLSNSVANITADEMTINLSDADYNKVPLIVSLWMQHDMNEEEKDFLFAQIKQMVEEKSLDIFLLANSLISRRDNINGWEKGRILNEILETHPEERKAVVADALRLIGNNKMGREDKILNVLRKMSSSERKDVIAQADQSIQDNMDEEQKANLLLEILGEIRQNAPLVLSSSSSLSARLPLPGNVNDPLAFVRRPTAPAMGIAPPIVSPMDVVESLKQSLIQDEMSKEVKTCIENVLKEIQGSKEDPIKFIRLANSLPVSKDDWHTKSQILKELQKIPSEKRETIVKKTLRLINAGATGVYEILMVLREIGSAQNSAEKLEDIVVKTIKLIQPGMTGVDYILSALAEVSLSQERKQLISEASQFIQDDMSGLDINFILRSLQQIDVKMRQNAIKIAQDLILKGMSGRQKSDILDVARNVVAPEKPEKSEKPQEALRRIKGKVNSVFPDKQVADPNDYYYTVIESYNSLKIGKINPVIPILRS